MSQHVQDWAEEMSCPRFVMHFNGHISLHGLGEMAGGELTWGINHTAGERNGNSGQGAGREGGIWGRKGGRSLSWEQEVPSVHRGVHGIK